MISSPAASPDRARGPAAPAGHPVPRHVPLWLVAAVGWTVIGALLVARGSLVADSPGLSTFGIVFGSIVVEALPFILLGAVVAGAMALYVPEGAFARFARLPGWLQVPGAAVAGVAFPVCECGSVPVGRRLIGRGVDPRASVAFMVAAPLVNPIVITSTWVAYGGGSRGGEMVAGRCGFGLLVAAAVGWFAGRRAAWRPGRSARPEHDHAGEHGGAERHRGFVSIVVDDFLYMGALLVLGAAISAGLQTAVPQDVIEGVARTAVLGSLAMLALAFVLCLCSEADAFVATSFTAFPRSAQLGFLLLGPVLDLKLSVLYSATFGPRFCLRVAAVAIPLILAGILVFGAVTG